MESPALEATGLVKRYQGGVTALDGLDLSVRRGEVYGLLGANGAGKTTTIRTFLGFLRPDHGSATVFGVDAAREPDRARRMTAYIPENLALYGQLSGLENLEFFASLAGRRPAREECLEALSRMGLPARDALRPAGQYSKGMRQKVGLAVALVRGAKAILMDEPTSGLDPKASNDFSALLGELRAMGAAVLMATHDLFRAKETATRIGIMRRGKLCASLESGEVGHAELEAVYLRHMRD